MTARLPGQTGGYIPMGTTCDNDSNVATHRTIGESDSFGSEYFYACDECHAKEQAVKDFSETDLDYEKAVELLKAGEIISQRVTERMMMRAAWSEDRIHRVVWSTDYALPWHEEERKRLHYFQSAFEDDRLYHPTQEELDATDWIVKNLVDFEQGRCDRCKKYAHQRYPQRDPEEGHHGPVYWVCDKH